MRKRELTEFGKEIKLELMIRNQSQEWLIDQLKHYSGMYVDSSILYKIMTGQVAKSKLHEYIREILEIA